FEDHPPNEYSGPRKGKSGNDYNGEPSQNEQMFHC
ncbi:MAG: hypothetical protein UT51_C0013G0001, partial [Candidatus Nomurabacteria bacterium GW2011_GWC2_39_41]